MENIRRALARWLLGLAKAVHRSEVLGSTPLPLRPEPPILKISDDVSWCEERVSQLHDANRELSRVASRWEYAYYTAMKYTRRRKRDQVALGMELREILGAA